MVRSLVAAALLLAQAAIAGESITNAIIRVEPDPVHAGIRFLSWDTEGGDRAKLNLLRKGMAVGLRVKTNGTWTAGEAFATKVEKTGYRLAIAPDVELEWQVIPGAGRMSMKVAAVGAGSNHVEGLELLFPFAPMATATTVLPASWDAEGKLHLPAVISAPDLGQMLLTANVELKGRLIGSRANHTVDFSLELPTSGEITLTLDSVRLPVPEGLKDASMWPAARRGWFNMFQPSAQWGDQGNRFSAPPGILANNVVSDPVSCCMHIWADQALLTPQFKLPDAVRRTVDWWLDNRTKPTGEVYAYWNYADMLDANASPLIAAWDYVEASGDRAWLAKRIERLELVANYLVKKDTDDDGLVESNHSGNYGTLKNPMRAGSAYDTINAGGKDAYCNALIYRAFRCLADLEKQLGRSEQATLYATRADRLKAAYVKTFFNPATGWLAWWKSTDGELHDLAVPVITSLAINYGLVELVQGREMLDHLWTKLGSTGFKRFDLGTPVTLGSIRRGDYLMGVKGHGVPEKEDGSDTFGQYLNGGCCVGDVIYFITALYMAGEEARGDQILRAMLARQEKGVFPNGGGFQNGVVNRYPVGAEFYTWDGKTCGYEGHLTYSYSFLQAVLLREPAFRAKLLRPLGGTPGGI